MNYIGADVHISSTTFTVLNSKGVIVDKKTIATEEKLILNYIGSIRGKKELTFEQGTLSQWLYNFLHDKVDRLVICNPIKNALIYSGNSNDDVDSEKLAKLLRLNEVHEVNFNMSIERQEFRELMNQWIKLQDDKTRLKNRLKAVYRGKGIRVTGDKIYNLKECQSWVERLPEKHFCRVTANIIFNQLSLMKNQEDSLYEEIKNRSKRFPEIKEFMKIKGVGLRTASVFSAFIFTPFRFKTKAKLVSYCALSLVENDTSKESVLKLERKRKKKVKRHLTFEGNKKIKCYLKSAALVGASCRDGILKEKYLKLKERGLDNDSAICSVTRSLAVILWGIWKNVERNKEKF